MAPKVSERFRWTVVFPKAVGEAIVKEAEGKGSKAAIWVREAAIERLKREGLHPDAAAGKKR